jgi:hypothetical protein
VAKHRKRRESDLRKRYNIIANAIQKTWPAGAIIPVSAIRLMMEGLDIQMCDERTQDKNLNRLLSNRVFGDAVLERVEGGKLMVLARAPLSTDPVIREPAQTKGAQP